MLWYVKQFAQGAVRLRPAGTTAEFLEVFDAFASTHRGAFVCESLRPGSAATIHLSPAAEEFALMIRAQASAPPARDEVKFLCGNRAAWQRWLESAEESA